MLWIKLKVGESVYISEQPLILIAKDIASITVSFAGQKYNLFRQTRHQFSDFALIPGNTKHGLRLGFEAPPHISIRREKLEVKL